MQQYNLEFHTLLLIIWKIRVTMKTNNQTSLVENSKKGWKIIINLKNLERGAAKALWGEREASWVPHRVKSHRGGHLSNLSHPFYVLLCISNEALKMWYLLIHAVTKVTFLFICVGMHFKCYSLTFGEIRKKNLSIDIILERHQQWCHL